MITGYTLGYIPRLTGDRLARLQMGYEGLHRLLVDASGVLGLGPDPSRQKGALRRGPWFLAVARTI